MPRPWDYWAALGIAAVVCCALGFALGAGFVNATAEHVNQQTFSHMG